MANLKKNNEINGNESFLKAETGYMVTLYEVSLSKSLMKINNNAGIFHSSNDQNFSNLKKSKIKFFLPNKSCFEFVHNS
jgi:hypothetical protein